MRIAIFADTFYPNLGGVEDSVALLAKHLGYRGHLVDVYAPKMSAKTFSLHQQEFKEINLGDNVTVHRLLSVPSPVPLASHFGLPSGKGWYLLKKNRPDIIHTHTIMGLGLESVLSARMLGVPMVGTNHSIVAEFAVYSPVAPKLVSRVGSKYDSWLYNHGELVTAPSSAVLEEMRKHGFCQPGLSISNPIDTQTFLPLPIEISKGDLKEKFDLRDRPVVTFAGRFSPEKRVEIILQAVALVKDIVPNVVLALAGRGVEEANWQKIIKDLKLKDNVKFVGLLNKDDLAELFQASDVFAIASPAETQSLVTLQAMACALPVVGVNARALPEYVKEGETGYLVPVDDAVAMADRILVLLKDQKLAEQLGRSGRQLAEQFSASSIAEQWEKIYNQVVNDYQNKKKTQL